jgi:hypothetical protein
MIEDVRDSRCSVMIAPPTLITANCCEETELKWDRYCWTSLFEPMLLSSCTTVDRVEKLSEAGDAYSLRDVRATAVADLVRFRAEDEGSRLAAVRALLTTVPAAERTESISRRVSVWV